MNLSRAIDERFTSGRTQMLAKFNNTDRLRVVSEVEKQFNVRLSQIGKRQVYLKDENDSRYCVIGGKDDWHDIPGDVLDDIAHSGLPCTLIIACKKVRSLRIFRGPMKPLLQRRNLHKHTFNIRERGDYLEIVELPSMSLELLSEIPYKEDDRERTDQFEAAMASLNRLSNEERMELLRKLRKLSGNDGDS